MHERQNPDCLGYLKSSVKLTDRILKKERDHKLADSLLSDARIKVELGDATLFEISNSLTGVGFRLDGR